MMKHQSPPENCVTQMNLYEEESREDWAEMRWLNLSEAEGGLHSAAGGFIRAAQSIEGVQGFAMELLQRCIASLHRDAEE